jgi:hypothetical protein
MANPIIKIKRSAVAGKIPTTASLELGELAINTYDGKVYIEQDQGGVGVGTTIIVVNPWSVGTGTNTYNTYFTAGNVGVGTTNPGSKLTVNGAVQIQQDSGSNNRLIFRGQPGSSYRWNVDNYSSSNEFRIFREDDATAANGFAPFSISTTGTLTANKFSGDGSLLTNLPSSGGSSQWVTTSVGIHTLSNVGIGTTNPTSKLTVSGNASITGILTADQVYTSNNGNGQNIRIGDDFWLGDVNAADTTRFSGAQDSARAFVIFGSSDAVALGRTGTGPLYYGGNFNVAGVITASSFSGNASSATYASSSGIATYATTSGVSTSVIGGIASVTSLSVSGISTFTNGPLLIGSGTSTGTASQRLQVTGGAYVSGSVGIATTNPQSALDVRGAITVGVGTVGINSISSTTDIQSWYYTGKSKNINGDDTSPQAIYIGAAGTAMFMVGDTGNDVNQYTLSTPYDVSTAGASVGVFSVATQETNPLGIDFNPTGTKMFISGSTGVAPLIASGEYVHEYSLSTAWTVSSAGYTTSYNVTQDTAPQGVTFGDSGSKMYVVGSTGDAVYQYSLSTPYSLASGVTYDSKSLVLGTNPILLETAPIDISFNSAGTVLWIAGSANDRIYEFRLGTAWDISTAVFYDDVYIGFNEITVTGLHVIPEQNVAYIVGSNSDTIYQYSTNTPALEIASSGISSESSIILNNETRVKDKLYVKGLAHIDGNILAQGTLTVDSTATVSSTLTASAAVTFDTTTSNINLATSQTTGTLILGGTSQTGTITLGRATTSQTTDIQAGVTASGNQKTINLGTGGAAGSRTLITVGSATAGAASTVTIPSPTNLLIGTATTTGTASQQLQVNSGAYVSGSVGIGTTNPGATLNVVPTSTSIAGLFSGTTSSDMVRITQLGTGNALVVEDETNPDTSSFVIANDGKVGIGITNPGHKLVISGGLVGTSQVRFVNSGSGDLYINHSNLVSSLQAAANIQLALGSNNVEVVRINTSGFVGIGTTNPTSKLSVVGDGNFTGVVTATTFFGALTGTATTASSVTANSVGLGTGTFGDYVRDITGTSNQITVTGGTGEGSTPTLSLPNQVTIPQDLTVIRDVQIDRNLNVNGNITIGGTSATLFTTEFKVYDPDIVLGFRTDALGNDVSTDNTANHGGIAIASTEGTPLISLYDVGVGETNPATYKKFMWFKSGTFTGLGTDAWLSNYAVGIGSTQVPNGVRLAAGGMQVTDSTLSVPQLNISGVSTFTGAVSFGTSAYFGDNDKLILGDSSDLQIYHDGTNSIIEDAGTGNLYLQSNNAGIILQKTSGNENLARFLTDGAVELYYDNTKEFETTGYGATVFGTLQSQQVNVSGVTTSTGGFVGNLTGTATTATNLADAANITTGTINSARLSGTYDINVSYASTAGVATVAQGLTGTPNIVIGVVTATSFVKSGGTSSQFLKADGSVDTSTYLTSYSETDTLNSVTGRGNSTANGISVGILTATSGNFSGIVTSSGANISGAVTATNFVGSGINLTGIVTSIVAGSNITISGSTGQVTINSSGGSSIKNVNTYTATEGQTTFSANYSVGYVDIYLNGVKLSQYQYTATNGTSIVLIDGASLDDVVEIVGFVTNAASLGGGGGATAALDILEVMMFA